MFRIAQALRDRAEELATLESRDNGKPLRQARTDVQVAARYFEFFAGIADKIMGNTIPLGPGFLDYTVREPIGVSAQIIPWNYPIQIGARGVAPALAAGCTVVLKPAEDAPMTALRLGEIALACGLPPGVLNVVPGMGPEAGAALASHPDINQLTFTGSVEVGIAVAKMAADNVVPVVMELGGKSPNIVFADADLELTAAGRRQRDLPERRPDVLGRFAAAGRAQGARRSSSRAWSNAGEVDARRSRRQRSGHGPDHLEESARDGRRLREDRQREGRARSPPAATRPSDPALSGGFFFQPTLLDRVRRTCASRRKRSSVRCSRSSRSTRSRRRRDRQSQPVRPRRRRVDARHQQGDALASRIKAGQVYINTYGAGGGVELPFGGYKKSGYGREKGLESLASYTQVKNVCVKFA